MRFFSPVLYLLSACVVASCEAQVRNESPVDAATNDASQNAADGGNGGVSVDASSLGSCAQPGECVLVTRTCCGVCGAPAVTDMDSVRWDETEPRHNELCGTGPVNCPRCAIMANPHLGAICRASHCAAVDVRTDATSSCTTDADCMLRF